MNALLGNLDVPWEQGLSPRPLAVRLQLSSCSWQQYRAVPVATRSPVLLVQ